VNDDKFLGFSDCAVSHFHDCDIVTGFVSIVVSFVFSLSFASLLFVALVANKAINSSL